MRSKFLLVSVLAVVPLLSSCESLSNWLNQPITPPPVVQPVEPPVAGTTPPPAMPPAPAPTIGDAIIDTVGDAAGTLTGNPVIGIVVAGILTALYGTVRGKVAQKATKQENKV